jgi:transposase
LSKKHLYGPDAERLFIQDHCTVEEIAVRLRISEKTVRNWKAEGNWDTKREQHDRSVKSFHEELYMLGIKMLKRINEDVDAGLEISKSRWYAFFQLMPSLYKVKQYEDVVKKAEAQHKLEDDITPDRIPDLIKAFESQAF